LSRKYRIAVIKGDGVGPEIVEAALNVLSGLGFNAEFVEVNAGYEFFKRTGKPIEEDGLNVLKSCDAVLKGPITTPLDRPDFKSINVMLRRELGLYANVRPFKSFKGISLRDLNVVLIRENTEDLYVGIEGIHLGTAIALKVISKEATEKIVRFAFNYAIKHGFKRITVVHKSNILRMTDGLFRDIFFTVARDYNDLECNEILVDSAAYQLIRNPKAFEVLVTENLYGDILADLLAGIVGSLGLCGSMEVGDTHALFEPVHGSAPDIAGRGIANPISQVISSKLMLEYLSTKYDDQWLAKLAKALDSSISTVIEERRILTPDLGGNASTKEVADAILIEALRVL